MESKYHFSLSLSLLTSLQSSLPLSEWLSTNYNGSLSSLSLSLHSDVSSHRPRNFSSFSIFILPRESDKYLYYDEQKSTKILFIVNYFVFPNGVRTLSLNLCRCQLSLMNIGLCFIILQRLQDNTKCFNTRVSSLDSRDQINNDIFYFQWKPSNFKLKHTLQDLLDCFVGLCLPEMVTRCMILRPILSGDSWVSGEASWPTARLSVMMKSPGW